MASPEESGSGWRGREEAPSKAWGIAIFGLIGATFTTLAFSQLRRSLHWWYTQLNRVQSTSSWKSSDSSSNRSSFTAEAWKRYNHRIQEEYEEEMERVRRIRHMQSVFNRERNKFRRGYESWRANDPGGYQHIPREDWYWKSETSYSEYQTNETKRPSTPRNSRTFLSHHYSVLGLDRSRTTPYTDAEVKAAFRMKAMECHPDQNQDNKEAAEEKFKEVMKSYEAIKLERKNESR